MSTTTAPKPHRNPMKDALQPPPGCKKSNSFEALCKRHKYSPPKLTEREETLFGEILSTHIDGVMGNAESYDIAGYADFLGGRPTPIDADVDLMRAITFWAPGREEAIRIFKNTARNPYLDALAHRPNDCEHYLNCVYDAARSADALHHATHTPEKGHGWLLAFAAFIKMNARNVLDGYPIVPLPEHAVAIIDGYMAEEPESGKPQKFTTYERGREGTRTV